MYQEKIKQLCVTALCDLPSANQSLKNFWIQLKLYGKGKKSATRLSAVVGTFCDMYTSLATDSKRTAIYSLDLSMSESTVNVSFFIFPLWSSLVVMVLTVPTLQYILQYSVTPTLDTGSALNCWHLKYIHFVDSYSQTIQKRVVNFKQSLLFFFSFKILFLYS